MGQAPSTWVQVLLVVLFVLPGVTYQFLRERWRGPVPGERDLGERVLRALTASVALDAVYLVVAGPELVRLGADGAFLRSPRTAGVTGLLLFVVVPAAAAAAVSVVRRRRARTRFRRTPTAWDHAFRDRGPCFVRVRFKDGTWAGGWYGVHSYATSFPQPGELFLQAAWRMNRDGSFAGRVDGTAGLLLRAQDIDVLELLEPPTGEATDDRTEPTDPLRA
ncbi:DUF6338 family protein [Amycolatopsis stemonae]